jgi:hypothetical protein
MRTPCSTADALKRFLRDPNRIAAAIAAERIKEMRIDNPRRYRVTDEAIEHAIAEVKDFFPHLRASNKDQVVKLVNKGRTHWPDDGRFEI